MIYNNLANVGKEDEKMQLKQIEKLEHADSIMLNLDQYPDPTKAIIQVGQELYELGLVSDPTNIHDVLKAYNENVLNKIRKEAK